jgi:serine protease Do
MRKLHSMNRLRVVVAVMLGALAVCGAIPAAAAGTTSPHWPPLFAVSAGNQTAPAPAARVYAAATPIVTPTVPITLTATPTPTVTSTPTHTLTMTPAAPVTTPLTATTSALTQTIGITTTPGVTEALTSTMSMLDVQARLQAIYRAVNPSVVTIEGTQQVTVGFSAPTTGTKTRSAPVPQDGSPNSMSIEMQGPLGSGFVWDDQGHIITNNHVVRGADQLSVTFADGKNVPATLVGADPDTDLAVLKINAEAAQLRPIVIADSTQVEVGQFAVVIGNPGGNYAGSMTFGIVSGLGRTLWAMGSDVLKDGRTLDIPDIIQVDAPINFGNSGGVLLDLQGRLIGVTSAMAANTQSIGFAVPSAILNRVVPAIIKDGAYARPWTGIDTEDLWPDAAAAMGLPREQTGALVMNVTAGGPADEAGILGSSKIVTIDNQDYRSGGDVIVAVDGQRIKQTTDIDIYLLRHTEPGQTVQMTLLRGGEQKTVELTLSVKPKRPDAGNNSLGGDAWLGIDGITLTPEIAKAMSLKVDQKGLLVQTVTAGSPAEQAGLQGSFKKFAVGGEWVMIGGDVIVALDGRAVEDMEGLATLVHKVRPGQEITLTILRDGALKELPLTAAPRPEGGL